MAHGGDRKILRCGVVQNGQLIEERLLRKRAAVSLGQSPRNTFVVTAPGVPRALVLFEVHGGAYHLAFRPGLNGKLAVDGSVLDFRALREQKLARPVGDRYLVPLDAQSRGKVVVGDVTVLFQFVAPPPRPAPATMPRAFRGGWLRLFDWPFVVALLASFVVQVFPITWIVSQDYPEPPRGLDALPDRFVTMLIDEKPPVEEEKPEEKREEKDKNPEPKPEPKPKDKPEPTPVERTPEQVAEQKAVEMRRMQKAVRQKTILSVIGTEGGDGPASFINTLRDGATDVAIAEAFDGTSGIEFAGAPTTERAVAGGEIGDVAGIDAGALRTSTERRAVTTGQKAPEVAVRGSVVAKDVEESFGTGTLDQREIKGVVNRRMGAINGCYEKQLKRNPKLAGKVGVQFTILESGRVGEVRIVEDTIGDGEVARCITARMRGWRFPPPAGGAVTVRFPFIFEPAG